MKENTEPASPNVKVLSFATQVVQWANHVIGAPKKKKKKKNDANGFVCVKF